MPTSGIPIFHLCPRNQIIEYMKQKKEEDYINEIPMGEVWNTYHYIAKDITKRLVAFRKLNKRCYPPTMSGATEWNKTIDKMIKAFCILGMPWPVGAHNRETVDEGMRLFFYHYEHLRD